MNDPIKWLIIGFVFLLAAIMLFSVRPAHAYTPVECEAMTDFVASCAPRTVNPNAKIIHVAPEDDDITPAAVAARRAWAARCRPYLSDRDRSTGMRHWVFAERGCEFGP